MKIKNTQITRHSELDSSAIAIGMPSLRTVSDKSFSLKLLSCAQKILNQVQNDG